MANREGFEWSDCERDERDAGKGDRPLPRLVHAPAGPRLGPGSRFGQERNQEVEKVRSIDSWNVLTMVVE